MKCYEEVGVAFHDEDTELFKSCDCLPSCNSIDYDTNINFERFIPEETMIGVNITRGTSMFYFADEDFVAFKRSATFGTVTLLSNIGGMLGLFLGISVLSVVEIFYFFVIRFFNNLWWRK